MEEAEELDLKIAQQFIQHIYCTYNTSRDNDHNNVHRDLNRCAMRCAITTGFIHVSTSLHALLSWSAIGLRGIAVVTHKPKC